MSKAPHFKIAIVHPRFPNEDGPNTVVIEAEVEKAFKTGYEVDGLIAVARDVADTALKHAAGKYLVHYESFGNDSDYAERIDQVVAEMTLQSMFLDGESKRYSVGGIYSDGGGDWMDWVYAIHDAEAVFQAKWTMAENQRGEAAPQGDEIENFFNTMEDINITYYQEEPVTKEEYKEAFRKLVEEAIAAGLSGPAIDDAIAKLQSDGIELEASTTMTL